MNHPPPFYPLHHPYPPSHQQPHQDHHYPPTINHHMNPPPSSVYHHHSYPPSNHLYAVNTNYQNTGFGYQPHLHSYSSNVLPYSAVSEPIAHYYDTHSAGSSGYMQPQPSSRMEDKPYDYYPPPPPRYSTGKEYGRVNNNNNNKAHSNNNNNKRVYHNEQHKPSEKTEPTNTSKDSIKNPQLENKRKINVDMQPNKRQKQAVQTTNITSEKSNETIVNNSNSINNKNEEKSSDEKLDLYRVLRVCAENSSLELNESDVFKFFPNALKVRKENQRDFLVEFSSLVDMIPYIESETTQQEEENVNISIPKRLIPAEYANDTQKLVLEFVEFLKKKQQTTSCNNTASTGCNPSSNWENLITSIKIPQNVSPYELLDFRKRRVKKVLGKTEFGILIHEKPTISDKIGFPLYSNPNLLTSSTNERFFFFAFCKTGTTFLTKEEISKCFPNARSVHFDQPGDHRIIIELSNQNDFNAYKKISHSGKFMVRNHTFLLRKANPKDIPPEVLNPPLPQPLTNIPTSSESSSIPPEEPKNGTPDKNLLLLQLRQQMDHPPETITPKQDPKELRSTLLAQMKAQTPKKPISNSTSNQSLENFISLSDPESEIPSSEEEEITEETEEEDVMSNSSESNHEEEAHPQTPSKDKTQLLSALREQMQQSAEKKPTKTTSASSSNILGIKRKTFASHYALFHGNFHK